MNRSFGTSRLIGPLAALTCSAGVFAAPTDWIGRNIEVKAYGSSGLVDVSSLAPGPTPSGFCYVDDYLVTISIAAPTGPDEVQLVVEHVPTSSIVYDQIHYWDGAGWFTDLPLNDRLLRIARPGADAPQENNQWRDTLVAGVFMLFGLMLWRTFVRSWRERSLHL